MNKYSTLHLLSKVIIGVGYAVVLLGIIGAVIINGDGQTATALGIAIGSVLTGVLMVAYGYYLEVVMDSENNQRILMDKIDELSSKLGNKA